MRLITLHFVLATAALAGCGGSDFSAAPLTEEPLSEAGLEANTGPDAGGPKISQDAASDASVEAAAEANALVEAEAGDASSEGADDAAALDVSADVVAEVADDVAAEAQQEASADTYPEAADDVSPDAADDSNPDAADDTSLDVVAEALDDAPWEATDFDAFTSEAGVPCVTGLDQPKCINGSEYPWVVPMFCTKNEWKQVGYPCNYGCDASGQCICTAPAGRLMFNVVAGPPQQRYIEDTVTGYHWAMESGWTGNVIQAIALCASVPGGTYRLPTLNEILTLVAEGPTYDQPTLPCDTAIDSCCGKDVDPMIIGGLSVGTVWYDAGENSSSEELYGLFYVMKGFVNPYTKTASAYTSTKSDTICIKN